MMAWHMETARNAKERAVPLSSEQIMAEYAPFREESGDAYALVQHQIADFIEYRNRELPKRSEDAINSDIDDFRASVIKKISFNLEHGYLYPTYFNGSNFADYAASFENKDDVLKLASEVYLSRALGLYEKYGPDPAVTPAAELPQHINSVSELSPEDQAVKRQFDTILADGFESLRHRMEKFAKKFGKKTVELFFQSGEIPLPPTKVLPTVTEDKLQETK